MLLKCPTCAPLGRVEAKHGDVSAPRQEAHKMVREANIKQATAEKQLCEAQGKVTVVSSSSTLSSPLVELLSLTL